MNPIVKNKNWIELNSRDESPSMQWPYCRLKFIHMSLSYKTFANSFKVVRTRLATNLNIRWIIVDHTDFDPVVRN